MQENVFKFAVEIRAGRTALGWSQTELAARAGVARPTVARIESFAMQPKLDTAERLKAVLRVAGVEFLDQQPAGGFTMIVRGSALKPQLDQVLKQEGANPRAVESNMDAAD